VIPGRADIQAQARAWAPERPVRDEAGARRRPGPDQLAGQREQRVQGRGPEQGLPFGGVEQSPAQQQVARGTVRLAVTLGQAPLVDPEAARVDQAGAQVGDDLRFGEGQPPVTQIDGPAGIAVDLQGAGGLLPG
jgi:hypothetical protein